MVGEQPGASSAAEIASLAASMFCHAPPSLRALQRWRPFICPFEELILHVPTGSSVLDVGCGAGLFLGVLHQTHRLARGVGFDPHRQAIEAAKQMAEGLRPKGETARLTFLLSAVEEAWPDGSFSVVSMIDVMHHVAAQWQRRVLTLAADRVRPGGRLLYKDMCLRPLWRALANRAHDLLVARQWIHYVPIVSIEAWAEACGLRLIHSARINRLWYGHELRVFERRLTNPQHAPRRR